MFERLLERCAENVACRTMVELLSLAHERACEAELAGVLESLLAAPKGMPDVVVELVPLSAYEALLSPCAEEVA
ncbi:MAG: IS21 family transposase, partial [Blastomonas fulva]